ncbi:DEAD/DEAH box helicase family protein [Catenuloplanes atrovinosus]|uniref:Restriction endonuclease n=1 Tax=Catenuloplanes atrovinosus TaxID=137266 RepID=A0AAE3YUC4_9ACTN|nr:DEAD/DEAH box helicase family protein [Catenuloplanes atrovinosus]MDR7278792.1 restriction endonuclease [Catenuloplanes atrovinosus]
MRLRYAVQPHQTEAVAAVVDTFAGQPHVAGPSNAPPRIGADRLLANVRAVQSARGLPPSSALVPSAGCAINLDVEMETGTGKTYAYIKTIFELHRAYGWGKFVVVVPGIAIREGVDRTFAQTAEHFMAAYGRKARFFVYRSRHLHRLESFASGPGINVMIINMQSFTGAERRRIHTERDDFQSRRPIDVLAGTRPVLILDEPQRMEGGRTLGALTEFRPIAILRYSATHRIARNLVHRLDAHDAHRRGLVKRIAVHGVTAPGLSEEGLRRVQIREAVRAHLDREARLGPYRVKVLSLFFIDSVARYRDYARPDGKGDYARVFEEEYRRATGCDAPGSVHRGYFSVDRRTGRLTDPAAPDDEDAFDLILRDRERLLSPDEPVRFLFSHSALREGWDNPNVFVICLLKRGDSTISRRQEVGRGLRLAVGADGERLTDPALNELTVITPESYRDFVAGLQREFPRPPDVQDATRPRPPRAPERPPAHLITLDSAALITACVTALNAHLPAAPPRYTVTTAAGTRETDAGPIPTTAHDLLADLADATGLTRRTLAAILTAIHPAVFAGFARDPRAFLTEAARVITDQRRRAEIIERPVDRH